MPALTDAADAYEPTGDPEHVAYGAAYYWQCTCGASASTLTSQTKATARGRHHARYCAGRVVVDVTR